MATKQRDPLAPLEFGVTVLLGFSTFITALVMVFWLLGAQHVEFFGINGSDVCVTTSPAHGVDWGGSDPSSGGEHPFGLRPGSSWNTTSLQICESHASVGTVLIGASRTLLTPVGTIGSLVLLWLLIRRARRDGLFGNAVPSALRRLAYFLLAWAVLGWAWGGLADTWLLRRMADPAGSLFGEQNIPLTTLLLGLGLITLARVMTYAVDLREDNEATV